MRQIKCEEPGCSAYISDPCIKIHGLFLQLLELDLNSEVEDSNEKRKYLNLELKEILGENMDDSDLEKKYSKFKIDFPESFFSYRLFPIKNSVSLTSTFTLRCINQHKRQYSISC